MSQSPHSDNPYEFCAAQFKDLDEIIALLSDDPLGSSREQPVAEARRAYEAAFAEIERSPDNSILVVKLANALIGCAQITMIPNLTFTGAKRCQIEGVRVSKKHRGQGIGDLIIRHAIELAREEGCRIVQLTSNNTRTRALKFYEALGFEATHTGFKLYL